jgi:peroxiredoxin
MKTRRKTLLTTVLGVAMLSMLAAMGPGNSQGEKAAKAEIGKEAPNFTLKSASGKTHSLKDFKGKIVVLEWINPDCPYVVAQYDKKRIHNAMKATKEIDKDVVWLTINSSHYTTPEQNKKWMEKHELKLDVLLDNDGKVGHMYDAKTTPHMYVIDKEGKLRYHGAFTDDMWVKKSNEETTNYVVNAVRQIANDETVAPDHVKPWGCSVKYAKK